MEWIGEKKGLAQRAHGRDGKPSEQVYFKIAIASGASNVLQKALILPTGEGGDWNILEEVTIDGKTMDWRG